MPASMFSTVECHGVDRWLQRVHDGNEIGPSVPGLARPGVAGDEQLVESFPVLGLGGFAAG